MTAPDDPLASLKGDHDVCASISLVMHYGRP